MAARHACTLRMVWPVLLGLCSAAASASDPMRPLTPGSEGTPPAAASPVPAVPRDISPPGPPALVATRRAGDGRWEALVDRRWLRVGDRLGGARIAEVHGDRVVLARGTTREILWLLPPLTAPRAGASSRP